MSNGRRFAGWLCVALGFALIVMLGAGVIDPVGVPDGGDATSLAVLLAGLLPSVLLALLVFALGLWLLKGRNTQ